MRKWLSLITVSKTITVKVYYQSLLLIIKIGLKVLESFLVQVVWLDEVQD